MFPQLSGVDWARFAIGAIFLLFPLPLLFGKTVQYREFDRNWNRILPKVFRLYWHWLDPLRAFAGTWLLCAALGIGRTTHPVSPKLSMLMLAVVLGSSVVVQTVACKAPDAFHAPLGFVAAIALAIYPLVMAALVLTVAITCAFAFRSASAFFGSLSLAIIALGESLFPNWIMLGTGAAVSFFPILLALLFQRELVLAHCMVEPEILPDPR